MGVKAAGATTSQPHNLRVPNVIKSGNINLLESSLPHRACYGTPLPLSSSSYVYKTLNHSFTASNVNKFSVNDATVVWNITK
jgi:hypothetical protein